MALLDKSPQFSAPAHCPFYPQHGQATRQQTQAITPQLSIAVSFPRAVPFADSYSSVIAIGVHHLPSGRAPPSTTTA